MSSAEQDKPQGSISLIGPARSGIIWLLCQLIHQIMRIAIRHQVLVPEMERLLRWQATMLALHHREFAMSNSRRQRATDSHAAVVTGLGRREIRDMKAFNAPPIDNDGGQLHRLIRIVTLWSSDPDYLDPQGNPRDIPLTGKAPCLHDLNRRVGRSLPDRVIADWLVESGNAEWLDDPDEQWVGKRLRWRNPVVSFTKFSANELKTLGLIGNDFLHSLQEAANPMVEDRPRFRETWFSDIPAENLAVVHAELKEEVHESMGRFRKILEKYRDSTAIKVVRVGVGAYTFKGVESLVDEDIEG